jgi:hypothetical protein
VMVDPQNMQANRKSQIVFIGTFMSPSNAQGFWMRLTLFDERTGRSVERHRLEGSAAPRYAY